MRSCRVLCQIGLLALAVSPDPAVAELQSLFTYVGALNGHRYYVSTIKRTWNDARTLCSLNGGYLASIGSQSENDLVLSCLQTVGEGGYIGLHDKAVEGTFQWVSGDSVTFTNWLSGEPNNQNGTQDVVYMKSNALPGENGKWDDGDETNQYYFVMEVGPGSLFELGGTRNGHSYYISTVKRTWMDAAALCNQNGGSLATISSQAENDVVLSCLTTRNESGYIGLSDRAVEGQFQWLTGEPLSFTNWLPGEPNNQNGAQDVVYMKANALPGENGKWDDGDSTNLYYFVLEIGATDVFEFGGALANHEYYISTVKRNWSDAKLLCELSNGYLVTIAAQAENDMVLSCFTKRSEGGYIGLSDRATEGQFLWITGEPLGYTNWMSGEPNNQNGTQDVVYMKANALPGENGKWDDGDETNLYYFVMEKEVTSTEIAPALPNRLTLSQNYPNPFNPSTTLSFELPTRGYVQLSVFNLLGQHLADLVARELEAGVHTATFDGRGLSSGTYIYRVHANGQTISKKLVLMK